MGLEEAAAWRAMGYFRWPRWAKVVVVVVGPPGCKEVPGAPRHRERDSVEDGRRCQKWECACPDQQGEDYTRCLAQDPNGSWGCSFSVRSEKYLHG